MRLGVSYNGCKVCHCQQRTETISARFQVSSPTHPTPSHAGRHPLIAWQAHSHSESASERSTSTETTRRRGLSAAQRQSCGQRWCILPVVVVQISVPLEGSPVAGVITVCPTLMTSYRPVPMSRTTNTRRSMALFISMAGGAAVFGSIAQLESRTGCLEALLTPLRLARLPPRAEGPGVCSTCAGCPRLVLRLSRALLPPDLPATEPPRAIVYFVERR